ncbi:PIN domain nuclease [Candidatus Saccharibacteria bacterium]|nr:PIN domain nuclease [Candidatus Saccharibacteria bacterium]
MNYTLIIPIVAIAVLVICYIAVRLMRLDFQKLLLITIGFVIGAGAGVLISIPLNQLPAPYSNILPITLTLMSAIAMAEVFYQQHKTVNKLFPRFADLVSGEASGAPVKKTTKTVLNSKNHILVDTSAIIDGRIADIAKTGFVPGKLLVPRFVLAELQNIADSEDAMRRGRGRRGLEMLNALRENPDVEIDIVEDNPEKVKEVDHKLVYLARKYKTDILTTDYNLNRVATIEKVRVLNINELSQAIRAVVLPGEHMMVKVVQAGKEKNQGVGYLADGTMIVVEGGDKLIGEEVSTEVTRIFQTVAGKMIFAVPIKASTASSKASQTKPARPTPKKK